MTELEQFLSARDALLTRRTDWKAAQRDFEWPKLTHFNWARDYFDTVARDNTAPALQIVEETGATAKLSYDELRKRSNQVGNFLLGLGAQRGDRILLMLGNEVPLWETMLAAIKIGAVVIPATTLLSGDDLQDRLLRGNARWVITNATGCEKFAELPPELLERMTLIHTAIAPGEPSVSGWIDFALSELESNELSTLPTTLASDPLLEYFTSGTTAKAKLVQHTQASYPVGHLSTLYWLGLQKGDIHWTISSPGWAKHAWSCFFAPLNAQACVFIYNYSRFNGPAILDALVHHEVNTLCAPPTVWRMLILQPLRQWPVKLRELLSAGEPLNPEVIEQVRTAWNLTIRDGYGQTETTAQIGNPPGVPLKPGSMGLPLPGFTIALLDVDGQPADEGEICIDLAQRPLALMNGYADDPDKTAEAMRDGYYHTGDIGARDADGYITYVGRADDVFKSSGYRISPFELESVLIEHPAVAEAAVVPSPDPVRGFVPKAYLILTPGHTAGPETARSIFGFLRERVSAYKLVRRIEFSDLPKTISGKIRRVELRGQEQNRPPNVPRTPLEFFEDQLH
jgi:acetyl-CoA synthetase